MSGKKLVAKSQAEDALRVTRFSASMSFCLECFRVIESWFALTLLVHA